MDFIYDYDLDTSEAVSLPAPASPANISLSNINNSSPAFTEDFTKRLSSRFSILSSINAKSPDSCSSEPDSGEGLSNNQLADQFAKLSIDMIRQSEQELTNSPSLNAYASSSNIRKSTLSEKLFKILNNSSTLSSHLDDTTIKTSLQLLEAKNYLNSSNDSQIDEDYDLIIQPGILGTVSRRKLKINIQNEALLGSDNMLAKFEPIYNNLKKLDKDVENLNQINEKIIDELSTLDKFNEKNFKQSEKFNLSVLKDLKAQKDKILIKKHILMSFQKKFQLNEYEKFLLQSSKDIETNTQDYFQSFQKTKTIYDNCYLLLSMNNPKIGLGIMNEMKSLIDTALNNMNFFIKQNLSELNVLKKADFQVLKNCIYAITNSISKEDLYTPDNNQRLDIVEIIASNKYLKEMIHNFIDSKSKSVLAEFENIVRENERQMYSAIHDPMRFIGDMLASVHSLIVSEREILEFLCQPDEANETQIIIDQSIIDINDLENHILNNIIGVLNNPLKLRLEQTIRSQNDVSIISKLYDCLDLYKLMFSKQLRDESAIIDTLSDLQSLLQERTFSILHSKQNYIVNGSKGLLRQSIDDSDLQCPDWLIDYMNSIQDILKNFNNLGSSTNFMNLSDDLLIKLIDLLIDKPIEFVDQQISNSVQSLGTGSAKIVKINCLDLIMNKIMTINTLSLKYDEINDAIIEEVEQLTNIANEILLKETGLLEISDALNKVYPVEKFSEIEIAKRLRKPIDNPDKSVNYDIYQSLIYNNDERHSPALLFSPQNLQSVNGKIEMFIPDALSHPFFGNLSQISSPTIANEISESGFLQFVNFYRVVHTLVVIYLNNSSGQGSDFGDEVGDRLFGWNDIEIATLLGVEKAYMEQQMPDPQEDEDRISSIGERDLDSNDIIEDGDI
ncbi:Golgi transport complex subunit [Saccharomycopsis crataegensis]|uniref:Conserved oligomeric Golgi complex subunit 6 n=1 Tax=Saccharomycopsis crataegensis TaxID=43959 RepID=A0AAV5QQ66_9ASCO|nr:Golgi transport complex subunit [Saccharomycopsis crataegensis]